VLRSPPPPHPPPLTLRRYGNDRSVDKALARPALTFDRFPWKPKTEDPGPLRIERPIRPFPASCCRARSTLSDDRNLRRGKEPYIKRPLFPLLGAVMADDERQGFSQIQFLTQHPFFLNDVLAAISLPPVHALRR